MSDFKKKIISSAEDYKLTVNSEQSDLLERFWNELSAWNKKINLTAITTVDQALEKHFIDSMIPIRFMTAHSKVLDMGSGGGFPGIVLKTLDPSLNMHLVDSVRKKINFLKHTIRQLNLKNIEATHTRIEDLAENSDFSHQFDVIISRAFADLKKFVDFSKPFLKHDGQILAMKGPRAEQEITTDIKKSFHIESYDYTLPVEQSRRTILKLTQKR